MNAQWWQDAVVYEVYPRSFADASGDGLGDLPGIVSRLPYLADLGADALWLTPFYPSPLADGGYDVGDYTDVDSRLGTMADFDTLVSAAASHGIRVIVDLVPNHCSARHPMFLAALAAGPGSPERDLFIFRDGRGADGDLPPNNWRSAFGGPAWTRVAEADGRPGQWYLHLFDSSQPDWNWRNPEIPVFFEKVIRFWLDRGAAGLRVDVANGLYKDPDLPDTAPAGSATPDHDPCYHRPELQELYRSWRAILDSYDTAEFPGQRTAIGEVWYPGPQAAAQTLRPYLASGGLRQVFNFQLLFARWDAVALREAIDATFAVTDGSSAPWILGSHDATRPVTRLAPAMTTASGGDPDLPTGSRRARAAALLQLALPGSACIYQGEELGLPEVLDLPDAARADPTFRRTGGEVKGRDGCRVPLPWSGTEPPFGFCEPDSSPWLPQPEGWGTRTAEAQNEDPGSFLNLYRSALRLRRELPALGAGRMEWAECTPSVLTFTRGGTFRFVANLGAESVPLPAHREMLLTSGPLRDATLPSDTAVWLAC
jgi:alpha-glucosidase